MKQKNNTKQTGQQNKTAQILKGKYADFGNEYAITIGVVAQILPKLVLLTRLWGAACAAQKF